MDKLIRNVAHGEVFQLAEQVCVEAGRVNSLTLAQMSGCKVTLFAMDADEGMASHAAQGDAFVTALEGTGEIVLEGTPHVLTAGQSLVMSAGAPHSVRAITPFKMLLVVVKDA